MDHRNAQRAGVPNPRCATHPRQPGGACPPNPTRGPRIKGWFEGAPPINTCARRKVTLEVAVDRLCPEIGLERDRLRARGGIPAGRLRDAFRHRLAGVDVNDENPHCRTSLWNWLDSSRRPSVKKLTPGIPQVNAFP